MAYPWKLSDTRIITLESSISRASRDQKCRASGDKEKGYASRSPTVLKGQGCLCSGSPSARAGIQAGLQRHLLDEGVTPETVDRECVPSVPPPQQVCSVGLRLKSHRLGNPEILPKIGPAEARPAVQTPLQTSGASHSSGCSRVWGVLSPLETVWPPSYPSSVG